MKTLLHVNQHHIKANSKGANLPVLTVKDYKQIANATQPLSKTVTTML
jgi:hypothetical protein